MIENVWPAGHPIFTACPIDADSIKAAREFILMHELTADDVKLVKRDGCVQVIKRKDVIGGYWGE